MCIRDSPLIELVDADQCVRQCVGLIGERYFDLQITGCDALTSCLML